MCTNTITIFMSVEKVQLDVGSWIGDDANDDDDIDGDEGNGGNGTCMTENFL